MREWNMWRAVGSVFISTALCKSCPGCLYPLIFLSLLLFFTASLCPSQALKHLVVAYRPSADALHCYVRSVMIAQTVVSYCLNIFRCSRRDFQGVPPMLRDLIKNWHCKKGRQEGSEGELKTESVSQGCWWSFLRSHFSVLPEFPDKKIDTALMKNATLSSWPALGTNKTAN